MPRALDRRAFLAGTGRFGVTTTLGLPLLEAMLNSHGTALAQGTPLPLRIGIFFWGNGLRPEHFFPEGAVSNRARGQEGVLQAWDPAGQQHTAPLAAAGLTPYVSLVTGTRPYAFPLQSHHHGKNAVLTGSYDHNGRSSLGYAAPITPSFDQVAAQHFSGSTDFPSLVLAIQEGSANNEQGNAGHFTSSTGNNNFIQPEYSPLGAFQRIFMGETGGGDASARQLLLARRSILDAVRGDIQRLNRDLGAKDRACLDQHLMHVRSLEQRLGNALSQEGGGCVVGEAPGDFPTINGVQRLRDRSTAMSDCLALALACDKTRAFSFQFTVFQTGHDFGQEPELQGEVDSTDPDNNLDFSGSFHEAAHRSSFQDNVRKVTNFTFENLAYLLRRLADMPEGDSNVLANSAIMATTEHTEPMSHQTEDIPMVFAGTAGGRLRGGQWYHGREERVSKGGLTLLRAVGVPQERFGVAHRRDHDENDPSTTETFTALET